MELSMIEEDVRERIIAHREALNLSQNKAAKLCGLSQSVYWNMETGKTKITLQMLEQVAQGFQTTVAELMGFQSQETQYILPPESVHDLGEFLKKYLDQSLDERAIPRRSERLRQLGKGKEDQDGSTE